MKIRKLTMALIMAGAAGAAGTAYAGEYDEGDAPNLEIQEEAMIVLYEAMMSIAGANVIVDGCKDLEDAGKIPFSAFVNSEGVGSLSVGKEGSDKIILEVEPAADEPGRTSYGQKFLISQDGDGVLYYTGYKTRNYNDVSGYTVFNPAFSKNGAIFHTAAYMELGKTAFSVYDEHVIKDFYKLDSVEGKCEDVPGGTSHPGCTAERAFFDWGLEVITKYDFPFYKYRQDSEHIPWNGEIGAWIVRKSLLTGTNDNSTDCHLKAVGTYFAPGDDIEYNGNLEIYTNGS